ncbi:zinc finger CCHC domain-containing 12-like protein [Labeo rohita]|uniref:Zinc finger CCHC domain-containing 12-like protein n=1 Tax=Labeo rohita TaxID=84645 RepID=A0A498NV32_LABRO|nr:zinc finger CCHC domain-containing 12-like protein [Labeo rohita]
MGGDATRSYLKGLREIAELSGVNFEIMLSEMLTEMSSEVLPSCAEAGTEDKPPDTPVNQDPPEKTASVVGEPPSTVGQQAQPAASCVSNSILTSTSVLNPPDVQRLVVEHVVRTEEANSQSFTATRLRAFSGRIPRPVNEAEYDTWRTSVDFVLRDPTVSKLHGSRKILDSHLPPAADIVKHLGPEAPPSDYLQLLDSAFGTVEDGDELLAKFMNTLQNAGEKPSTYLSRLQAALSVAVKRGGVLPSEADRHLLKQFCRGCWDNNLIADLGLEQKRENPPSFSQLLLMLRIEEDKYETKAKRMSQVHTQRTWVVGESEPSGSSDVLSIASETKELKKQIASLQSQLARLTTNPGAVKKTTPPVKARKNL